MIFHLATLVLAFMAFTAFAQEPSIRLSSQNCAVSEPHDHVTRIIVEFFNMSSVLSQCQDVKLFPGSVEFRDTLVKK